jgi:hypothetical protein
MTKALLDAKRQLRDRDLKAPDWMLKYFTPRESQPDNGRQKLNGMTKEQVLIGLKQTLPFKIFNSARLKRGLDNFIIGWTFTKFGLDRSYLEMMETSENLRDQYLETNFEIFEIMRASLTKNYKLMMILQKFLFDKP